MLGAVPDRFAKSGNLTPLKVGFALRVSFRVEDFSRSFCLVMNPLISAKVNLPLLPACSMRGALMPILSEVCLPLATCQTL